MVKDRRGNKDATAGVSADDDENAEAKVISQADSLISFRQLRERRLIGAKEVDLDDEADISKATGESWKVIRL